MCFPAHLVSVRMLTRAVKGQKKSAEDDIVVRVELKAKTHHSVKTIRVPKHANSLDIIKETLNKNHIVFSDLSDYDLTAEASKDQKGVRQFTVREKEIFDSVSLGKGLDEGAYRNPLFGEEDSTNDTTEQEEYDDEDYGDRRPSEETASLMEMVETERRERISAEERASAAESRAKELAEKLSVLEAQLASRPTQEAIDAVKEEYKKKKNKYKIEIEKLKTQVEVQQEQIEDYQKELADLKKSSS